MLSLDTATVIFMVLIITCICALLIMLLWRNNRHRYPGLHLMAWGFAIQTLAMILLSLHDLAPEGFSMVAGNALIIAAAITGYISLERFLDKRGPQFHNVILLGLFILLQIYFTYIAPNTAARLYNSAAALLIICLQYAWLLLWRAGAALRPITRDVGLVFLGFSVLGIARILAAFARPDMGDYFETGNFQSWVFILYGVFFILFTYTLSLMINRRLLRDVYTGEEKFSKVFHSSPYALILSSLSDGRILDFNDGFLKMFGYDRSDVAGKSGMEINTWYNPEDRELIMETLRQEGGLREKELLFRHKSGQVLCGLVWSDVLTINAEPFVLSSIIDITGRKQQQFEREALIEQLQQALADVRTLSGLLPICSSCKKIRDDKGYWNSLEAYIQKHSPAKLSHSICPECTKKLYPEYADRKKE